METGYLPPPFMRITEMFNVLEERHRCVVSVIVQT